MEQDLARAYRIVEGSPPWGEARECSFEEFSEKYTLHDSSWLGLFYDVAYSESVVMAFVWDGVWLPGELKRGRLAAGESPLLLVKAEGAFKVATAHYGDVGGVARGVAEAVSEREGGGVSRLVITDHYGGQVKVSFKGSLKFLALDEGGRALPI